MERSASSAISSAIAPALPANTGKQWQRDDKSESGQLVGLE